MATPIIEAFFDPSTFTYSYVIADAESARAAIIDPVLDYDAASGTTCTESADQILDYLGRKNLQVEWILETHIHADHLTAAAYLKSKVGGKVAIGAQVVAVQEFFGDYFNVGCEFNRSGSQFDSLLADGDVISVGSVDIRVLHTPGHTPGCVTYVVPGAAFVGDTLFMPDYGTARTDFPGGDARTLYQSIQRIFDLPQDTTLYMCHDYGSETRTEFRNETTVAEERQFNKLVNESIDEQTYVAVRECKDAKLNSPKLLLPAVQFNIRAGELPPADSNGVHYFKIPVKAS